MIQLMDVPLFYLFVASNWMHVSSAVEKERTNRYLCKPFYCIYTEKGLVGVSLYLKFRSNF